MSNILLVFFCSTLLFRSLPRIAFVKVKNFDTYFHLYFIDFIKSKGTGDMVERKRFIRPLCLDYPWLIHWLISFLPQNTHSIIERFLNSLLDSMFAVIFVYILHSIGFDTLQAILGGVLYVLTPLTYSNLGTGPRIITFTPRLFGEVIGGIVFLLEYLYFLQGEMVYFVFSIFFAASLYMISKFAVQALVLINISLSILLLSWEPIALVLFSFLICLAFTRGYYIKIFKQQVNHLTYYFKEVVAGRWIISDRNNFLLIFSLLKQGRFKQVMKNLLVFNSYSILIYKAPVVIVAFFALYENGLTLAMSFLLSGVCAFLLTSLKWFLFIGEAERYINFILVFGIVYLLEVSTNINILYILVFYGLIYYMIDIAYLFATSSTGDDKNDKLIDYLKEEKEPRNIATIPFLFGGWRIVSDTHHNWFYPDAFFKEDLDKSKKYLKKHPYIDLKLIPEFMREYSIDCVYVDSQRYAEDIGELEFPSGIGITELDDGILALVIKNESE